jgi:hypothetical protein
MRHTYFYQFVLYMVGIGVLAVVVLYVAESATSQLTPKSLSPTLPAAATQTAIVAKWLTKHSPVRGITPPPTGRPPTLTPAPFLPGIYETSLASFGVPQAYAMTTRWQDIVNGERTVVYAGARKDTSGALPVIKQGLIAVAVYSSDLSNWSLTEIEAPGETGILTIQAVSNEYRLTLTAQDGTPLYFDVPTRRFVASLTEAKIGPTVTRLPPIMPTATWPALAYPPSYGSSPPAPYP